MTRLDERHQQRDSDSPKTASLLSLDGIRSTVETGERLSRQSDNADGDSPEVQQAEAGLMAAPMLLRQGSEGLSTSDRSSRSISATDGSRSISATDGSRSNSQLPGREALLAALKGESSGDETQFSRSSGNTERSGSDRDSQMVAAMMERTTSSRQAALDLQQSGTRSAATTPDAALSALTAQSGQAGSGMMATQGQAVTTATLPSMDSNQWSSALERQTINLGLRGGGEAKLSMSPAELGPLSISLKMGEQGAQLHIGSHSAQVRAAIEAALPQLRDAFSASGIQLGETSVSDQGAFAQQNFQQQGEGSGSGRSGSAAAGMSGSVVAGGNDDIQTLEIPAGRTLSGGIDLFA
ncbi:flagellar hook-length control protein FliK [Kushneria aurantia]|uniref:Flagellar hook-length control protein FliK n=1 Tax=Kushneria aurantia TaxID=504092 RepID=A0ABV6G0X1_9GAMM|nr:flagellar hook-length control protein FliK [Kushneria aurantia]